MADGDGFDPARFRIACDPMEEAGFGDVAEWVRGMIAERERRGDIRRIVIARIMRDVFLVPETPYDRTGLVPVGHFRIPEPPDDPYGLIPETLGWLRDSRGIMRGMRLIYSPPERDAIQVRMYVRISGRDFVVMVDHAIGQPLGPALDRCHRRLVDSIGREVELV